MESIKSSKEIVMKIIYKNNLWIAFNDEIEVSGKTMKELDENLINTFKTKFKKGTRIRIRLEFDYSTIPFWITQYHPYYFYRILEYEI